MQVLGGPSPEKAHPSPAGPARLSPQGRGPGKLEGGRAGGGGTKSNQAPVECNSRSIAAPNKCNRF